MGKHLSDIEIDKVIKGKTSKVEFFLKWKEWTACKECHAEAYIRFYEYLQASSAVAIATELFALPIVVEAAPVPVAQAVQVEVVVPPVAIVPLPPPVVIAAPAPVPMAAPPLMQPILPFQPDPVVPPAPAPGLIPGWVEANEQGVDLDLDIGQNDPPDLNP
jgi:hypothetical protein